MHGQSNPQRGLGLEIRDVRASPPKVEDPISNSASKAEEMWRFLKALGRISLGIWRSVAVPLLKIGRDGIVRILPSWMRWRAESDLPGFRAWSASTPPTLAVTGGPSTPEERAALAYDDEDDEDPDYVPDGTEGTDLSDADASEVEDATEEEEPQWGEDEEGWETGRAELYADLMRAGDGEDRSNPAQSDPLASIVLAHLSEANSSPLTRRRFRAIQGQYVFADAGAALDRAILQRRQEISRDEDMDEDGDRQRQTSCVVCMSSLRGEPRISV